MVPCNWIIMRVQLYIMHYLKHWEYITSLCAAGRIISWLSDFSFYILQNWLWIVSLTAHNPLGRINIPKPIFYCSYEWNMAMYKYWIHFWICSHLLFFFLSFSNTRNHLLCHTISAETTTGYFRFMTNDNCSVYLDRVFARAPGSDTNMNLDL